MGRRTSRRFLLIAAPIAVLTVRARAQPAPDAQPVGGTVVAGAATIARSPTQTSITQTTQRAAINWQGFDVGSRQNVTFAQPSATAMTLNRVTGPNPSQIAGRITANGQIVLVNPAGVVFYKGAQVNTNGLLVTAAGISDRNFMAGRMVFDQPAQPNAKVENRGEITIRQAGLAALVAPQVANSGVISARLGHVVLAGARTATLDLYGDGLVAIDVTGQVRQVPLGPDGKPVTALVTNTGIVRADGGTVQLTAQAADGIVQTLVEAGGRIQADSAGSRTGTIVLSGLGGAIRISGQLDARGRTPGSAGGRIVADTNGDVLVGSSARIDASGDTGGGMIVLGTTLARGASGPAVASTLTARRTRIDAGAKIAADASGVGNGGRVVVLSDAATVVAGSISARGGATGGNGGLTEISSNGALSFTGTADLSAPAGTPGTILFDPLDLLISDTAPEGYVLIDPPNASAPNVTAGGFPDASTNSWITPVTLEALAGNVVVQTSRDLTVASPLFIGFNANSGQSLTLQAGRNLTVDSVVSSGPPSPMLGASGDVVLLAGTSDSSGAISLYGPVVSQLGSVFMRAPQSVFIGSEVVADATGRANGITGKLISIRSDSLSFDGGTLDVAGGTVEVAPFTSGWTVNVGGQTVGQLDLQPLPVVTASGFATPDLRLGATTDPISHTLTVSAGNIAIGGAFYAGGINGANLELDGSGTISQSVPVQDVGTLSGQATNLGLSDTANTITALGPFNASNVIALNDAASLTIDGPLAAQTVLIAATGQMTLAGTITSPSTELAVLADGTGNATFVQSGSVSLSGSGTAPTLTIVLPATGGSVSFAGLNAPGMQLDLDLSSGTASGTTQLAGLLVRGAGGSAALVGSVAGLTTRAAAAISRIIPSIDPHYTFNGCTIGDAACGTPTLVPTPVPTPIPPAAVVPSLPPMTGGLSAYLPGTYLPIASIAPPVNLSFVGGVPPLFGQLAGPDVVLPNISFRDY